MSWIAWDKKNVLKLDVRKEIYRLLCILKSNTVLRGKLEQES